MMAPPSRSISGTAASEKGIITLAPRAGLISKSSPAPKSWKAIAVPTGSPATVRTAKPIRSAW